MAAVARSASVEDIQSLRSRVGASTSELSASDKAVIAEFWTDSLGQMMFTKVSKECVAIRRQLAGQRGSEDLSFYTRAYVDEAKKAIEAAFKDAGRIGNVEQRQMIERNLMILTGELRSPALADLALARLDAKDVVVRHWAFKALTEPTVVSQLTSDVTGDEKMVAAILKRFQTIASAGTRSEERTMIVRFCMVLDDPLARDILLTITDQRVKAYRDWSIDDETSDALLLTAMGSVAVLQESPAKQLFARKFAELYALTIQRYLKGQEVLSKPQLEALRGVIGEVDDTVLGTSMGVTNSGILAALTSKNNKNLERAYENVFGDRMRAGMLARKFEFDYGKDTSGKAITSPPELRPPPKSMEE